MAWVTRVGEWRRRAAAEVGCLLFEATDGGAREGKTVFFKAPQGVLEAYSAAELQGLMGSLEGALRGGSWVAGYVTYEGACALLGLPPLQKPIGRLAWFGVYGAPEEMDGEGLEAEGEVQRFPLCLEMEVGPAEYARRVRQVQAWLAEGQSYQMNLTTTLRAGFRGDALALYESLARSQPSAYTALLHTAEGERVLSFSPEMLFRLEQGGRVVTRPMKGTAPRDEEEDWLRRDTKSRAEHVMIVDLLRNDLGRVCEAGSVAVEEMFAVERYRTLLQMTSTIAGRLRPGTGLGEVMRALLPAGSMTGAPKRRTVELLREVEGRPRGIYSGAIGFAGPEGQAVFSVPIRTVELGGDRLRMGVGGGVVADSRPEAEWAECWLKARFLTEVGEPFEVVETMQWNGSHYLWLEEHMDRLEPSAGALGYRFDRSQTVQRLQAFGRGLRGARRVRLTLARDGAMRLEDSALELWDEPLQVSLAREPVWSGDTFLMHKTTFRPVYDGELGRVRAEGFQEALFANERGELTEGAISSVVLRVGGRWVTPPISAGVLPGVARGILLRRGEAEERVVLEGELEGAEAVVMVNGVRGVAQVRRMRMRDGAVREWGPVEGLPRLS